MKGAPQSALAQSLSSVESQRAYLKAHPRFAWKHGLLWHKLDSNQLKSYWRIRRAMQSPFARYVLKWARRTGKTYLLLLIAIEECIRKKRARYNIAAATKESLKEFIWPAIDSILEDCPADLRPHLQEARGRVTFKAHKTGSYLVLAGCNDKRSVERLRGPKADGNIIEEMGAMPESPGLPYVLKGVLNPQLLTTGGWTLMATTPPKSAGHASAAIVRYAESTGEDGFSHCTLYDNPRLTPELIQQYLEADAALLGMTVEEYKQSADYRREWLAIIETDPTYAVLPEATEERIAELTKEPQAVPIFRDRYEGGDLGFSPDWTAWLFGYWDFPRQKLVIEDELLIRRVGDTELAEALKAKEKELWGEAKPYARWADNNYPMTLSELSVVHGLLVHPTSKDEKEAQILHVRRWIRQGKIEIHPRCKHLVAQLKAAVWNKHRTSFERSEEFGHFDLVDALIYLVRNVVPNQNRIPQGWGQTEDTFVRERVEENDTLANAMIGG